MAQDREFKTRKQTYVDALRKTRERLKNSNLTGLEGSSLRSQIGTYKTILGVIAEQEEEGDGGSG